MLQLLRRSTAVICIQLSLLSKKTKQKSFEMAVLFVFPIHVLYTCYIVSWASSRKRPYPGGYLTKFNTGRLRPEVQPLTLLYTNLAEKVPLLYTFCWKKVSLSHTYFRKSCSHFHVVLNKLTDTAIRGVYSKNYNLRPFDIPEAWKRYPFLAESPRIGHYREYPPGGGAVYTLQL